MRFSCAARTDVGVVRSGTEDTYLMAADRGLFKYQKEHQENKPGTTTTFAA
jgi:hypothetical protein